MQPTPTATDVAPRRPRSARPPRAGLHAAIICALLAAAIVLGIAGAPAAADGPTGTTTTTSNGSGGPTGP